eukprot:GHUV01033987.1.p1 GENE.GHUV01033987.1~~GHUV01033987.1.p1  ORF type:complete len:115 (+),score=16.86 GHUV01033987.1:470-814(+)
MNDRRTPGIPQLELYELLVSWHVHPQQGLCSVFKACNYSTTFNQLTHMKLEAWQLQGARSVRTCTVQQEATAPLAASQATLTARAQPSQGYLKLLRFLQLVVEYWAQAQVPGCI